MTGKDEELKKNANPPSKPPQSGEGEEQLFSDKKLFSACERLSSERYQAFVENIGEGVYEVDIHGNFLYFNDSLCRILGYPREDIQFQNFTKFMDEESAGKAFENFGNIYETEQGISDIVWKVRSKEGKIGIIELSANLIKNKEGEKIGFRGIIRDITDKFQTQEALRKSERRYRTLLDFIPYPLVVFTLEGLVSYLNPAFTETFGWTFQELVGKRIPYVPHGLEKEASENIKKLFDERVISRHETQRLTKDGRILDVVMTGAIYAETEGEASGELVILRDITREKRIARNNEALLRISMALPEYPDLEGLLDYVGEEIKRLLGVEGALVILRDQEKKELFFKAVAHDEKLDEERVKEIRWREDQGVAGRVIRTGEPSVVPDVSQDTDFYSVVDIQAGFKTRSLLDVPLRSKDRIIGVLCAMNKKVGSFDQTDVELLNMIAGSVALTIENARFADELKEAYKEVTSLNRAKDRVINHLSHELKTPLSVLGASINILTKRLEASPEETWRPTIQRAQRNLNRMLEMQYQVEDIMQERHYEAHGLMLWLLDACADELESLVAEKEGEGRLVRVIRKRIEEIFGKQESQPENIRLDRFITQLLEEIRPQFSHREVNLITQLEPAPSIRIPADALKKVVVGLIKNAIENTPDEGKIEISVHKRGKGTELTVRDYGVGITEDNQRRIFEGFFATQETMDYSSKRPYDFNAGGKGADLLRMKIFSERYNFKLDMTSSRCHHIPFDKDICPGRISRCEACGEKGDCHQTAGTLFTVFFPGASETEGPAKKE